MVIRTVGLAVVVMLLMAGVSRAQEMSKEMSLLKGDIGSWNAEIRMFDPEGKVQESSKGTETNVMLGNMWIISHFKAEMMGMAFEGSSQIGYNPDNKKYVGTWVDSMSPYAMATEGEYDEKTQTLTSHGSGKGPDGSEMKMKMTTTHNKDGSRLFTMYGEMPDGKSMKMMEILYTRAQDGESKPAAK
jgi:hypothetical protein